MDILRQLGKEVPEKERYGSSVATGAAPREEKIVVAL